MNHLVLLAQVQEIAPLRYTPAGIPALDLTLRHESEQAEAGGRRKVSLDLKAVALGDQVKPLQALGLARLARFEGFLSAQRQGRGVVFHITGTQQIQPTSAQDASLHPD
ncbi:primosomal replication protein N [Roseateles sp. BYS180W]|uniref:Replication restart protein PriB n=1 Tax=Roseateles rivi TaxID=3299028 RepID=A0ABW7FVR5_9BURK